MPSIALIQLLQTIAQIQDQSLDEFHLLQSALILAIVAGIIVTSIASKLAIVSLIISLIL